MAEDVLGYLKKYLAHGYVINPKPPIIDRKYETVKLLEGRLWRTISIFP
jgi:hypothetical protein